MATAVTIPSIDSNVSSSSLANRNTHQRQVGGSRFRQDFRNLQSRYRRVTRPWPKATTKISTAR